MESKIIYIRGNQRLIHEIKSKLSILNIDVQCIRTGIRGACVRVATMLSGTVSQNWSKIFLHLPPPSHPHPQIQWGAPVNMMSRCFCLTCGGWEPTYGGVACMFICPTVASGSPYLAPNLNPMLV